MASLQLIRTPMLASLLTILAACASGPRIVSISDAELQQRIRTELSVPITLLKIFDVALSNPLIRLEESTGRIHAEMDTWISSPLSAEPIKGRINLSGKLAYDASRNAIVLTEPSVENLNFPTLALDDRHSGLLNMLTAQLGSELLHNITLSALEPDD
jgi:hypothetical protein